MTPYFEKIDEYKVKPSPHQLKILASAWDMAVYDSHLDVYVKWDDSDDYTLVAGLLPKGYPPPLGTALTIEAYTGYVRYYDKRFKKKVK